jgi:sterol desaturase/sphingolipid hydroxylase (fatty acid hydroxylase superfamily)
MGAQAFPHDAIQAVDKLLQQTLPGYLGWVAGLAKRTLEYAFGPILDTTGRFPWFGLVFALLITVGAYLYDRSRSGKGFLGFCFPREIYRHKSAWVDVKVGFLNHVLFGGGVINVTWRLTTAFFAAWVTRLLVAEFGPVAHPSAWGPVSIVAFALAFSLASDFGYFLYHWASHIFPPLWAIHKLHHSAEVMTPLTAARVHPLERVIMGPCMAATTGALMGPLLYLHGGATAVTTIFGLDMTGVLFFALGHVLHHSHVWVYFGPIVGRVIVSPAQHQIHHSCLPPHLDKNFAEHWSIWDTIFGTLYLPQGRETLKLGLAGYAKQPHPSASAAFLRPVADSVAAIYSIGRRLVLPERWRQPSKQDAVLPAPHNRQGDVRVSHIPQVLAAGTIPGDHLRFDAQADTPSA